MRRTSPSQSAMTKLPASPAHKRSREIHRPPSGHKDVLNLDFFVLSPITFISPLSLKLTPNGPPKTPKMGMTREKRDGPPSIFWPSPSYQIPAIFLFFGSHPAWQPPAVSDKRAVVSATCEDLESVHLKCRSMVHV